MEPLSWILLSICVATFACMLVALVLLPVDDDDDEEAL